ncbi:hypothetical protein LTR16_000184 [Cryomyces antarcticus]|uniref:Dynamin N-terminal domain-containing protein n=1 Tax=Cryomyces antarcticus TaxID=329879 RepID=A0ABR0LSL5_9PEZI|nr:hypothetical protein LTR39_000054 [Cryomyces antarcticus]KAK5021379.1 hypothetical protein LTR60_000023 [Cryomyces antarcticus]KAK5202158.1 hypothetical protein LTR16_000184 [Cryomyces antarcticus]
MIMDVNRNAGNQGSVKTFKEPIRDFDEVLKTVEKAMAVMGDIVGETKGAAQADVELVVEIADKRISQPRTICLAVVSATNDRTNQRILTKVTKVDEEGERTLGIVTKPDRLSAGSGSEKAFLNLARNEDVFFKLS